MTKIKLIRRTLSDGSHTWDVAVSRPSETPFMFYGVTELDAWKFADAVKAAIDAFTVDAAFIICEVQS